MNTHLRSRMTGFDERRALLFYARVVNSITTILGFCASLMFHRDENLASIIK